MQSSSNKAACLRELCSLRNIGKVSAEWLYEVGVQSRSDFMQADPCQLYQEILDYHARPGITKNLLKALIGAQENISWLEVELKPFDHAP